LESWNLVARRVGDRRCLHTGPIPQGRGADARDAFETLIDRPGCKVTVTDDGRAGGEVTIEASEPAALAAFVLQRLRQSSGKSLSEVAQAMGRASKNAYARYEQGRAVPTIEMFDHLLRAVSDDTTLIIGSRRLGAEQAPQLTKRRKRRVA
jgi:hypothetical protein